MSSPRRAEAPSLPTYLIPAPVLQTAAPIDTPFSHQPSSLELPLHRLSNPPPTEPNQTNSMASFLLPRSRPLFSLTLGLGLSSLYASQALYRQKPRLCEGPGATPLTTVSESFKAYSRDAKVPVFKDGRPNPRAYRQISAGSIVGM